VFISLLLHLVTILELPTIHLQHSCISCSTEISAFWSDFVSAFPILSALLSHRFHMIYHWGNGLHERSVRFLFAYNHSANMLTLCGVGWMAGVRTKLKRHGFIDGKGLRLCFVFPFLWFFLVFSQGNGYLILIILTGLAHLHLQGFLLLCLVYHANLLRGLLLNSFASGKGEGRKGATKGSFPWEGIPWLGTRI
jgi:hypothetical protein